MHIPPDFQNGITYYETQKDNYFINNKNKNVKKVYLVIAIENGIKQNYSGECILLNIKKNRVTLQLDSNTKSLLFQIQSQVTGSCIRDIIPQLDNAIGEDGLNGMRMAKTNQRENMLKILSKVFGHIGMMMVIKNLKEVMRLDI